jgi:hypothetical protein
MSKNTNTIFFKSGSNFFKSLVANSLEIDQNMGSKLVKILRILLGISLLENPIQVVKTNVPYFIAFLQYQWIRANPNPLGSKDWSCQFAKGKVGFSL